MKQSYALFTIIFILQTNFCHAMHDGPPEKRRRHNETDNQLSLSSRMEELLLMSQGKRYMVERKEAEKRIRILQETDLIIASGIFNCPTCKNQFNRTNHRIILLPCGQHRVCEECALHLLRPDKCRPATPKPCPECQHKMSDQEVILRLLEIAYRRVGHEELELPVPLVQRLLTTRSAYLSHDEEQDSEDTQGEDIGESEEDEEEEKGSNSSIYDSSFIDDESEKEEL